MEPTHTVNAGVIESVGYPTDLALPQLILLMSLGAIVAAVLVLLLVQLGRAVAWFVQRGRPDPDGDTSGTKGWTLLDGDLIEQGRQLASRRDDLIASGVDPAELAIPLAPAADVEREA